MRQPSLPVYLDYAAATPIDPYVLKVMTPLMTTQFHNPSATYLAARTVREYIDDARHRVAHWLGANSGEIIFTAGGTEANNLAIHGVMREFPNGNIVISAIEHASVREPAQKYDCRVVAVHKDGQIDLQDLEKKIDDKTVLVSIMQVNNEIGTIQPLRQAAKVIQAARGHRQHKNTQPLYFHSDACQAANYLDLHVSRLGVDLLTINGGKIYGPKQSGVLYVHSGTRLLPLINGGGQERGIRSGTENTAAILGLAAALDIVQSNRQEESHRLSLLQTYFFEGLEKKLPAIRINGTRNSRLVNNIHLTVPKTDNERLLMELDQRGIQATAGSACSASEELPSHTLKAIGLSDEDARSSLRFSMGRQTTKRQMRYVIETLITLVN
jgi:cysteine desulfurase